MTYEMELLFFRKLMHQLNLTSHVAPPTLGLLRQIDMGLRSSLGMDESVYRDFAQGQLSSLRHNVIYRIRDAFRCNYMCMLLPEEPQPTVLVVGPFIQEQVDRQWIQEFCKAHTIHTSWLPLLEEFFNAVPYLKSEALLIAALTTLGEQMWGPQQFTFETIIDGIPEAWMPLTQTEAEPREDVLLGIHNIERRYEQENQLMRAVSQGRTQKARQLISGISEASLERRISDPLRNAKNYIIILNTLLRKAVESGGVHPLYIDRLSSEFARRIEYMTGWQDVASLADEMVHKYCLLVKKHATKDYSPLVQKVMARVDFDLTADLSLKANAETLSVNASYLSTLFKKETGTTLTDYVNRKRVEHAAFLLSSTDLSVSAIGLRCGIQDDNYFTKIFKKYFDKTPKQYRFDSRCFPQRRTDEGKTKE